MVEQTSGTLQAEGNCCVRVYRNNEQQEWEEYWPNNYYLSHHADFQFFSDDHSSLELLSPQHFYHKYGVGDSCDRYRNSHRGRSNDKVYSGDRDCNCDREDHISRNRSSTKYNIEYLFSLIFYSNNF